MNVRDETSLETIEFSLPEAVAEALRRRMASHSWDPDRVAAAAILYFIENADARVDMLRRLIDVQAGAPTHTPPQDVLEHHRDEVFGNVAEDMVGSPVELSDPVEATTKTVPPDLADATITLDRIAENLARFNDSVIVDRDDDTPH